MGVLRAVARTVPHACGAHIPLPAAARRPSPHLWRGWDCPLPPWGRAGERAASLPLRGISPSGGEQNFLQLSDFGGFAGDLLVNRASAPASCARISDSKSATFVQKSATFRQFCPGGWQGAGGRGWGRVGLSWGQGRRRGRERAMGKCHNPLPAADAATLPTPGDLRVTAHVILNAAERSEESKTAASGQGIRRQEPEILRCAQNDSDKRAQGYAKVSTCGEGGNRPLPRRGGVGQDSCLRRNDERARPFLASW